ncbi:MAG: hypothetical protein IT370_26750 [Deltaproteobacteria bacterium]|nr:hypothetical protein [Deltaproteobacteria bacterium]
MRAISSGLVAMLLAGCVNEPPDGLRNPLPIVEAGAFRFQGVSEEHARWYQARYADFTNTFGPRLAPGDTILISVSSDGPPACLGTRVPGEREVHPCRIPGGYKLVCARDRQCPLRFAELLADLGAPQSTFLRDGLADVLAGGVTTPTDFDFDYLDYTEKLGDLISDDVYLAETSRLYDLYERDWYQSMALRYSLRRTAARFVAFLAGRLGAQQVPALLRQTNEEWKEPTMQRLLDDFRNAPPVDGRSYARLRVECETPAIETGLDFTIPADHGAPLYYPMGALDDQLQARTFEVTAASRALLQLESPAKPYFHLQACSTGVSLRHGNTGDRLTFIARKDQVREDFDLAPGRYVLIMGVIGGIPDGSPAIKGRLDLSPLP